MKLAVLLAAATAIAADPEELRYVINWPSGLALGEAQLRATPQGAGLKFDLKIDAAIPGFQVNDRYASSATVEFCSIEAEKYMQHGRRVTREKTEFDTERGIATRQTIGGGKSEFSIPACARDALTFLQYTRHELSRGRVPPPQTIYFGAQYQIRLQYGGVQRIRANDQPFEADKLVVSVKGAVSEQSIEFYFARDTARTPVLVKLPLSMGLFSMEITR